MALIPDEDCLPRFFEDMIIPVKPADAQKAAKVPVWQGVFGYFSAALQAVGAISRMGCVKHNNGKMPTKWREYPLEVYSDALARHITEEAKGIGYDPESHMLHAAHAAWNALARLEKLLEFHPLMEMPNGNTNSKGSSKDAAVEREVCVRTYEAKDPYGRREEVPPSCAANGCIGEVCKKGR